MEMEMKQAFAERLKVLRNQRSLTQEQMAECLELTYNGYVKIENAYNSPSLKVLVKISDFFNVSLDLLIFGKVNDSKELSQRDKLDKMLNFTNADDIQHVIEVLERIRDVAK